MVLIFHPEYCALFDNALNKKNLKTINHMHEFDSY